MPEAKVLVVGAGPVQTAGIVRAKEMGLKVVATDGNAEAPGLAEAHASAAIDVTDVAGTLEFARSQKVNGVLCVAVERAVTTVAAVAAALGLPGTRPLAAERATNKRQLRHFWDLSGVPSCRWRSCSSADKAHAFAEEVGFPVVVKPADNAGSRGVRYVDRREDIEPALAVARANSHGEDPLVEEFMPGIEISVEGFVFKERFHCLTLSDKVRTPPPHLLDTEVLFGSDFPLSVQDEAARVVEKAAAAIGLDNCVIHAELIVRDGRPHMVELAARGPGFKVFTEIIPWVTGHDVVADLILMSLGQTPSFAGRPAAGRGAVLKFPQASPGVLRSIQGLDEARRIPGIAEIEIYVKPGDIIRRLTSGSDRVGHIISLAERRAEAVASVLAAEKHLRIQSDYASN